MSEEYTIGRQKPKTRKHTGCRVGTLRTSRGTRYYVRCGGTNMKRFISKADYDNAINKSVTTFLPDPFTKK